MSKYLDLAGLTTYDNKIKTFITDADDVIKDVVNNQEFAKTYGTIQNMVTALNAEPRTSLKVGFNLFILSMDVPDFWITEVMSTNVPYTYTTDAALIQEVQSAPIQIGYYKISMLETAKVDLSGYVPTSRTINSKPLTGNISLTASDVGAATQSSVTAAHNRANEAYSLASDAGIGSATMMTAHVAGTNPELKHPMAFGGVTKVDGFMSGTDKEKLDGIAAGAQVNPTAAQIKTQYESNSNTNAFTDAEKSKLSSITSITTAEINGLF